MTEALEIMRRLLDGEKLTYEGAYYQTDRAKLYPPDRLGPHPARSRRPQVGSSGRTVGPGCHHIGEGP